jgi:D-alanyl-lipoteichoic acid acyltransferase DltB (MBOAT superfamily)
MLFNSHIFLFVFFPVTLAGFFFLARFGGMVAAQIWLTLASFVFYGWSGWRVLPLLALSILVNFAIGRTLVTSAKNGRAERGVLAAGIAFNLLLLGYFKYAGFLVATADSLTGSQFSLGAIVLPVGISFYTFTQIAFLVDASRGEAAEYDLPRYALFVSFFPHLIAGPIIHHKEMMPQFAEPKTYRWSPDDAAAGLTLFALGLFKKVAFADRVAPFATPVFAAADMGGTVTTSDAWIAALAYTAQIYFDFSAYSDMAIGISQMFGIHLPLNFNSPYKARSAIDFWRRWHMTLSRFLRDYLYFPLGGNRKGPARRYANLMITMLLGGLWHGAGWTFVVWGGLHGLYLIVNHAWRASRLPMPEKLSWLITFLAVVLAWVFFRAHTFHGALAVLRGMAGLSGMTSPGLVKPSAAIFVALLLALAVLAPNTQEILRRYLPASIYTIPEPDGAGRNLVWSPTARTVLMAGAVLAIAVLLLPKATEFLYFQF